jgi:hypothetical protein
MSSFSEEREVEAPNVSFPEEHEGDANSIGASHSAHLGSFSNFFGGGSVEEDASLQRATLEARANRRDSDRSIPPPPPSPRLSSLRPLVAFSLESENTSADGGVSSFLAACVTADFISVGYLLVPWGECTVVTSYI